MDSPFPVDPETIPERWRARWIWDAGIPRAVSAKHEIRYFRRTFEAPSGGTLKIHVSADSRYQLFLNGFRVAAGPCKGDGWRKHYETVALSLREGRNVLAARVLHFHPADPPDFPTIGATSVWRTAAGGFLLQGTIPNGESVDTDEQWKVLADTSTTWQYHEMTRLLGETEKVDGAQFPHGWNSLGFDDSEWQNAVPFFDAMSPEREVNYEFFGPWSLTPSPLPLPPEAEHGQWSTRTAGPSDELAISLIEKDSSITLDRQSQHEVILDAGVLRTAYVSLILAGGKGSTVCLTYAESLGSLTEDGRVVKGIRDDPEAGGVHGAFDTYVAGQGRQVFEPFWWRTFRFVRINVKVGDEPLTVGSLSYAETTGLPEPVSTFSSSEQGFRKLWDISVRTLKCCTHETYEDCPYYEQLQYTMDTRLEALYDVCITGDGSRMLKAIHDFHCGWHPSGLLQSRFPSVYPQIIPGFALHWVLMLNDHWQLFGDAAVPRRYRSTVDGVLDWFDRRLTADGLVGPMPYWPYFDWVPTWGNGIPPGADRSPATVFSALYAVALRAASDLATAAGYPHRVSEYNQRADAVTTAMDAHCWDAKAGMFLDGPETPSLSVHAQAWPVLAGTSRNAAALVARCLDDKALAPMNWAMQFYLFRALKQAGLYERAYELWPQWYRLVDMHVTTWPEDDVNMRSDCHAWGSVPLYEFTTEVLGVQPATPGFGSVRIQPQPGPLQWARGTVATALGPVSVGWKRESGHFSLRAEAPGRDVEVLLPDGTIHRGQNTVEATST